MSRPDLYALVRFSDTCDNRLLGEFLTCRNWRFVENDLQHLWISVERRNCFGPLLRAFLHQFRRKIQTYREVGRTSLVPSINCAHDPLFDPVLQLRSQAGVLLSRIGKGLDVSWLLYGDAINGLPLTVVLPPPRSLMLCSANAINRSPKLVMVSSFGMRSRLVLRNRSLISQC